MPATLKPIDDSLAYTHCPLCKRNGTAGVMLRREKHEFVCPFQHRFNWAQLQQFPLEMTPMSAIVTEQPDPNCIKMAVWVLPDTKARLEEKFAGRLIVTLGTFLAALADDQLVILTGEDAAKLRAKGIRNSVQIVAAIEAQEQSERERTEAVNNLLRLMSALKMAGAGAGAEG